MSDFFFLIILLILCIFFIKENNSSRSRVAFISLSILVWAFGIIIFFNDDLRKICINYLNISEFKLLLSLGLIFASFYTIYIYLEIRKIKEKLTFIIRSLALKNGRKNKSKIKK